MLKASALCAAPRLAFQALHLRLLMRAHWIWIAKAALVVAELTLAHGAHLQTTSVVVIDTRCRLCSSFCTLTALVRWMS